MQNPKRNPERPADIPLAAHTEPGRTTESAFGNLLRRVFPFLAPRAKKHVIRSRRPHKRTLFRGSHKHTVNRPRVRDIHVDEARLHRLFTEEKKDDLYFLDDIIRQASSTPPAPSSSVTPIAPVTSVNPVTVAASVAEPAGEFLHETKEQTTSPAEAAIPDDERIFLPAEQKPAASGNEAADGQTKIFADASPAVAASPRRTWNAFFRDNFPTLFGRKHAKQEVLAARVTESPAPVVQSDAKDASLDDLLGTPTDQAHEEELKRRERELAASGHASLPPAKKEVHVMEEAPTVEQGENVKKDEKAQKAEQEKKVEAITLEAPKETPKPAAAATATPPAPPKPRKKGANPFADFLGAIKYIGLGREKNNIVQNLATMLNAGLPLIDSLKALQMESRYKPIKKLFGGIVNSVEMGHPLWRSMENEHFFSPHAIALVRIGEEAGNLAENMEYLAQQQEKDQALRSKVKMAMIYPSIVMVLMFIVVMGLGIFVLPNLIGVLTSLNVPLPLVTRIVIAFTNFMSSNGTIIMPASVAGIIFIIILAKFTPLRAVAQWLMFHIPGIGSLARQATIARFGVIMGGLMQAGVPLVEALRSLVEVTPIVSYKRFYARLLERILLGDSFAKSFTEIHGSQKLLPISVQQLVMTGEKAGSLSKILMKIADIYEKKANETAQRLPVILEPMILLFIGALVATIAMAIIVPIYSIVGNVGH